MAKKWKVEYKTQLITENDFIDPDGYSSIVFTNFGTDKAFILNDIELEEGKTEYMIELPNVAQKQKINVKFEGGAGLTQKVVARKIYYFEN